MKGLIFYIIAAYHPILPLPMYISFYCIIFHTILSSFFYYFAPVLFSPCITWFCLKLTMNLWNYFWLIKIMQFTLVSVTLHYLWSAREIIGTVEFFFSVLCIKLEKRAGDDLIEHLPKLYPSITYLLIILYIFIKLKDLCL